LGTPTIALFGPTNPNITGPIFDTAKSIIKSKGQSEEDVLNSIKKSLLTFTNNQNYNEIN
jgi:ADP-heptose:LPS heptosyltransferase